MKNHVLRPLFWIMLFDTASYTIRFPVLTLVFYDAATRLFLPATGMVTRSWWYGVCMALYWVGSIIGAPWLSAWSDYAGRKKSLLIGGFGTFIFALSTALGVMWGSISLILVGALIGGLCSRMDPIAQATVGDVCLPEQKILYMSYLQLFISLGAFFGPIIGGYLAAKLWFAQLNFALPFIIATLFAAIGILILLFFFRETTILQPTLKLSKYFNFKAIVTNRKVIYISLLLIFIQLSWSTYYQFIAPILKKDFNFSGPEIGLFMGFIAFWLALASAFGIKILQRFLTIQQIIYYATFVIFIGIIGTLVTSLFHFVSITHYLNWIFAIPIAEGDVITYCAITTLYSDAVDKSAQGQVMAANFVIVSIVWGLTALIGGWLIGLNTIAPLWFALLGVSILIVILTFKRWKVDEDLDVQGKKLRIVV